jgi:predicted DCC family thiol-disulfide oxidoreductase YuxK
MKAITLFYDADCGICTACVDWLIRQAESSGETLVVIAYQNEKEIGNFPMIDRRHADLGIQTLSFDGKVRSDAAAFAACLRALPRWRWLGICMDWPLFKSVFQAGYRLVANNRQMLSRWFGLQACRVGKAPGDSNPAISKLSN